MSSYSYLACLSWQTSHASTPTFATTGCLCHDELPSLGDVVYPSRPPLASRVVSALCTRPFAENCRLQGWTARQFDIFGNCVSLKASLARDARQWRPFCIFPSDLFPAAPELRRLGQQLATTLASRARFKRRGDGQISTEPDVGSQALAGCHEHPPAGHRDPLPPRGTRCAATTSMPVQRCRRPVGDRAGDPRARALANCRKKATGSEPNLPPTSAFAFRRLLKRRAGDTIDMRLPPAHVTGETRVVSTAAWAPCQRGSPLANTSMRRPSARGTSTFINRWSLLKCSLRRRGRRLCALPHEQQGFLRPRQPLSRAG